MTAAVAGALAAGLLAAAVLLAPGPPIPRPRRRPQGGDVPSAGRRRSRGGRAAPHRCQEACAELGRAFAAELRTGRSGAEALDSAVSQLDHSGAPAPLVSRLRELARGVRGGQDPVAGLRRASAEFDAPALRALAGAWMLSRHTGAGLADIAERLADAVEDDLRAEARRRTQVAGPRATVAILLLLPAAGVAMATAVGAGPLEFLLGTRAGIACLLTGLLLQGAGLLWSRRLVSRAARPER